DFTQFTPTPFISLPTLSQQVMEEPEEIRPLAGTTQAAVNSWICKLPCSLTEVERRHILAMLRYTGGNKLRAPKLLAIGRFSLYRKAERLGIDLDSLSIESEGMEDGV